MLTPTFSREIPGRSSFDDPQRNLEVVRRFPFATISKLFGGDADYDFTALDQPMPHPVHGRNHFVCVLNPSDSTFDELKPLFNEAYAIAVKRGGARNQPDR